MDKIITGIVAAEVRGTDFFSELKRHPLVADVLVAEHSLHVSSTWRNLKDKIQTPYVLIYTGQGELSLGQYALERFAACCADSGAGMVYADYYEQKQGQTVAHPVIDYQWGSLRDDFNFGSLLFYRAAVLKQAIDNSGDYTYAALYDLRLLVSQKQELFHLPEYLYTRVAEDIRKSGEKIFDYVNPNNRHYQVEMEEVCVAHLKRVGAYLKPQFETVDFQTEEFPVEASVIIPVYNRVRTIREAVQSVLEQQTSFQFNVIVVDNYSTDGSYEILQSIDDARLLCLRPDRPDLGIGGCWNYGVMHEQCGKFAIQLDSDDLYDGQQVLQKIVEAFYAQKCAMVVGSYRLVNFDLEEIPPGVIDHREWTAENGRNNALRINGLGAPRAFFTPILRKLKLPNTSYGEDYALGLRVSRQYQIGRLYEPIYLCRRWEGNSDAALEVDKMNRHNWYKDKLRTLELRARSAQVAAEGEK